MLLLRQSGDWKIGGFELLGSHPGKDRRRAREIVAANELMPARYRDPLRETSDFTQWDALAAAPGALDAWSLGCLMFEIFSANGFTRAEELSQVQRIPKPLQGVYKQLLIELPGARSRGRASDLRDTPDVSRDPLVQLLLFLGELALKSAEEKRGFFGSLEAQLQAVPPDICKYKVLPELLTALEFGAASGGGTIVLGPVLAISKQLPDAEYQRLVAPVVLRLFNSTDR